jgi:tetratricopeptide (TPR) repeat protein
VTTNGSQYNERVERVLKALPVSFSISLDGATKETVEKIRVNCNYEEFMANILRFRNYSKRKGTYMGFSHCLMRENWHEFADLLLFADKMDVPVFVNTVITPEIHSLYTLPPEELHRTVDEMERIGRSAYKHLRLNRHVWDERIQDLRNNAQQRLNEQSNKLQSVYEAWTDDREETWRHTTRASELADKGRYKEALEEVRRTPENSPYYYYSVVLGGHLERLMGNLEAAEAEFGRAIGVTRRRPEAFINRAFLRCDQGRLHEGIEDALHARELIKNDGGLEAEICEILGKLYSRQGKLDEAKATMDRLLELQPDNPGVRVQRAEIFHLAGLELQALSEAESALALDPTLNEAIQLRNSLLKTV